MDGESPAPPGSPPLPKKGAYNIDFDNFDEFSNPFESKGKMSMGSSPPIQPSTFSFDEDADPFKSKKSIANSPPGSPKVIPKNSEPVDEVPDVADDGGDVIHTGDQNQSALEPPGDASVEEEKKSVQVTPKKKKMIKKPVQSKFKPPRDFKRNKNTDGDIEIHMPENECQNNNRTSDADNNDINFGVPHQSEDHANGLKDLKEDGPPPLDAAPEALAMSNADIARDFINKEELDDPSDFKDARDWTSSNNMNTLDEVPTTSERSNHDSPPPKHVAEKNRKSENEIGKSSVSEPIDDKHPAKRALQASQLEDTVSFGKSESSSEESPFYDAYDYAFLSPSDSGDVGKQQMSSMDKKGDIDASESKGTVVQLVQVLRYSQTDWNKMKQELELNFQTTLLNKERDWSRLLADRDKKITNMEESNKKLKTTKEDMRAVVTEFEKTMAQLQSEKEKMKNESAKKVSDLEGERNQALEDLASVENAFSDLHRRYEKSKTVIEGFKRNEEELKECMEDLKMKLKKSESKLTSLRSQAEEKLDRANEDIDKIKKSTKGEVARLEAALKKSELRISSLDEALIRKEKENQELTAICDELIAKVGS